jgi:aminopeptidase
MKRTIINAITLILLTTIIGVTAAMAQDDKKYQELAVKLVQAGSVKPGDVVVIDGGKHLIPLMESIAVEAQKAGGMPIMFLESDRVTRSYYTEVPEKYLEQEPRFWAEWLKNTNVFIGLPGSEDYKAIIEGVPETRFAKISKANSFFGDLLSSLPIRQVSIDLPTRQAAENNGMDFAAYQRVMMDGINADYQSISVQGNRLRERVKKAKQIRITSPHGTDFTFSPAPGREIYVDDGIVTEERAKSKLIAQRIASFPGGNVFFAPLETSANGQIAVPKMQCRYEPMNNVTFDFKDGIMRNFKAGTNGQCFQEGMSLNTGSKDRFGSIWLGVNPSLRTVEDGTAHFLPFNAAGMVYVGIGDNRLYGGTNNSTTGYAFPITNATVSVDGKIIIKDGRLMSPEN